MPSELKVNKLSPYTGTTLTIGDSGDTISFASGVLPSLESLTITGDLTVDTNTLFVDSTNNRVGIGETSPSARLHIANDQGGGIGRVLIDANVSSGYETSINVTDTGFEFTSVSNSRPIIFNTGSTPSEKMRIDGSGNVGIGTSSPNATLNIQSSTDASIDIDATSGSTQDAFIKFTSPDNGTVYLGVDDSEQLFKINNISALSSENHFVIDTSGNVGIGTASPTQKLEINSGTSNVPLGLTSTDANSYLSLRDNATSGVHGNATVAIGAQGDDLLLRAGQAERMRIDSSGNVGIGTNAPEAELHVSTGGGITPFASTQIISESAGNNYIELNGGSTSITALYFGDSADQDAGGILYNHSNNSMSFRANAAERMRITSTGNVGIGTSSPTAKLQVAGNALIGSNANGSESAPYISLDGAGYTGFHWLDGTAYYIGQNSNSRSLRIYSGSNENAGAQLSAGGTSFGTYSDERLKKDITDLTNGLDKISAIRTVKFKYKTDADDYKTRIGIIAQSLVGQVDEALDLSRLNDTDTTEYYNVRYQDIIPVLVKGMQEQQTQIEELKARLEALENA